MAPRGLYRTSTPESGAEYAYVDYGVASNPGEMTRDMYEGRGYEPFFDDLPTKEEYEASKDA